MSSGRTTKTVGRLYSAPINRSAVEQVKQPSPVSERSVLRDERISEVKATLLSEAVERRWRGVALQQGYAAIKHGSAVIKSLCELVRSAESASVP